MSSIPKRQLPCLGTSSLVVRKDISLSHVSTSSNNMHRSLLLQGKEVVREAVHDVLMLVDPEEERFCLQ